jgi:hypothetical protein
MKFDYENEEVSFYEDVEEVNGIDCLTVWQSANGIAFVIREDDYELKEEDDGYGKIIYVVERKKQTPKVIRNEYNDAIRFKEKESSL